MRIVIATPFYPPERGVLGTYAEGIQNALEKAGHDVDVVAFGSVRGFPPLIRHGAYALRVYRAARGSACILALDTWSVGLPALVASRLAGVPLRVRVGGDYVWEAYVERTKEALRLSDFHTTAASLSLKERAIRGFTRYLARHATLIFTTLFLRDIWARAYGASLSSPVVENFRPALMFSDARGRVFVSAGRSVALKRFDALERAFARVKDRFPKIGLDARYLSRDEHLARLKDCYAVIIPSLSEVSSNTAVDAVSFGKPFIMTEDTGTRERFPECGLYVDTRSEEALAAAIEKLLDPDEYEYRRARILESASPHSWEAIAREILDTL
jgi:glycosyltransferase involved in cell wall biosynthesis